MLYALYPLLHFHKALTTPIIGLAIATALALVLGWLVAKRKADKTYGKTAKKPEIIEQIDVGVLVTGKQGEILTSNPAAQEILGFTETELLGKIAFGSDWEVIQEDGTPLAEETTPVKRALAARTTINKIIIGIQKKPETGLLTKEENSTPFKWLLVSAKPQLDTEGRVTHVICTCTDISERQKQKQAYQSAALRYKSLFENALEGMYQMAPDGSYTDVNPAYVRLFGCQSKEELLAAFAETPQMLYPDPIARANFMQRLRQEDFVINFESEIYRFDGSIIWISENARAVRDDKGTLLYYQGSAIDISERKMAQESAQRAFALLQKNESRLQQLANHAGVVYQCLLGADGSLSFPYVSAVCRELCEITPEEIQADPNNFIDLIHPDDRAQWESSLAIASVTLQPWGWEGRLIVSAGDIKWFKSVATPEVQPNGDVLWNGLLIDITARKQAEEALKKSQQQLALHFQQTPLGVISWSLTFEVTEWNPAAERIFGYTRSEALGRHAFNLIVPETAIESAYTMWKDLLANRGGTRSTNENITKDGRIIICEWYNTLLVDASGHAIGVASLVQDITDRKRAEEELRESEQRFRATFEQAAVGFALIALDGRFLRVNQRFCEILGYTETELLALGFLEITHPDDRLLDTEWMQAMVLGQVQAGSRQKRYLRKNGSQVWVNLTLSLVREPSGEPKYFAGAIEDITERLLAEEALKESEERFRAIASATPIPISIARKEDGAILYANPALETAFGLSAEEITAAKLSDFYYNPTELEKVMERLQKEGRVRNCELCVKKADGKPFWITLSLEQLTFNGESAILAAFYDISDRKRVEEILRSRSRLSTLAAEVGVALVQSSSLPEILHRCAEAMELCLNLNFAGIWKFNPATHLLELAAYAGEQPPTAEFQDRIPLGFSVIGFIAQNRQPYITKDVGGGIFGEEQIMYPEFFNPRSSQEATALAGYPLIVQDKLMGVMVLVSQRAFSEADRSTLIWVANALAVAIDRLLAREELLSRREALLFHLANQIRNSLELNTILETAVREIRSLLQVDRCLFIWYHPEKKRPYLQVVTEAKESNLKSLVGRYRAKNSTAIVEKLLQEEIICADKAKVLADPILHRFARSVGLTSILALPIQTRTGAIGIVGCVHYQKDRAWNESEVELLQAVRDQLAIAIDQAELYSQSVNAAAVAQAKAKQLEQALLELQQTQAQLIQTEKMSSLGQLVAGVAHEINNPVNFIYANLSYARNYTRDLLELIEVYKEEVPEPSERIRNKIQAIDLDFIIEDLPKIMSSMQVGADRIRQIVLSLRNFSRLDEAEMKMVDLHEGIDNTLLILQNRLKPNSSHPGIQIIKEYGSLPQVECYAGQLNQVFLNIISNAIDALETQNKPGIITIRTSLSSELQEPISQTGERPSPPKPESVVIRIADNGPGMNKAVKERLFDPFFTTKPVGKGTGLGLSICYQIVVGKHKGELKCFSEPGKGAEFWIEIPIRQRESIKLQSGNKKSY